LGGAVAMGYVPAMSDEAVAAKTGKSWLHFVIY
jgi:hypothetical protein